MVDGEFVPVEDAMFVKKEGSDSVNQGEAFLYNIT
jgi:hypothetical protein